MPRDKSGKIITRNVQQGLGLCSVCPSSPPGEAGAGVSAQDEKQRSLATPAELVLGNDYLREGFPGRRCCQVGFWLGGINESPRPKMSRLIG